jgi:hypothetical protein
MEDDIFEPSNEEPNHEDHLNQLMEKIKNYLTETAKESSKRFMDRHGL